MIVQIRVLALAACESPMKAHERVQRLVSVVRGCDGQCSLAAAAHLIGREQMDLSALTVVLELCHERRHLQLSQYVVLPRGHLPQCGRPRCNRTSSGARNTKPTAVKPRRSLAVDYELALVVHAFGLPASQGYRMQSVAKAKPAVPVGTQTQSRYSRRCTALRSE